MLVNAVALLGALPLAAAHFTLDWPPARGFEPKKAGNFPCGGFDSVSSSRTDWPLNGGPVQLNMEHSQTNIKVLLAIGSNPGNSFNIVLNPTLSQEGLGDFCIGPLSVPNNLNISDGTPATIQVVTNGDPTGGLYQVSHTVQ